MGLGRHVAVLHQGLFITTIMIIPFKLTSVEERDLHTSLLSGNC